VQRGASRHLRRDQLRHVVAPLAQRRNGDPQHVEAVEEVGAEAAAADVGVQVALSGRDDARAQALGLAAPDPFELPVLEHSQETPLEARGELADLVEEQGAVGGALEAPGAPSDGARKGAPLVPEELALQDRWRERGAVGVHEGPTTARRAVVQDPREQPFPHPRLPEQQHGGSERRDPEHVPQHAPHRRTLCHQIPFRARVRSSLRAVHR